MFEITTTRGFCASHQLRLYDGSLEPLHGHNWVVRVRVSAAALDAIGVVMDFHDLERIVDGITLPMHNRHLNDVAEMGGLNPSAENVALRVAEHVIPRLPGTVRLVSVEVWETPENSAAFHPGRS